MSGPVARRDWWRVAGYALTAGVLAAGARVSVAQDGAYRIAGRVVSAADGRALQRATVTIADDATHKLAGSATTGEDGRFEFVNVKMGQYSLRVTARGYVGSAYQQHSEFSTAIVTGVGVDTESLVVKLMPEGAIGGRITDERTDPVRHAMVSLYFEDHSNGGMGVHRRSGVQTDDLGRYEFDHLAPGRYYVSATATPWYAVHPQPAREQPFVAFVVPDGGSPATQYLMPSVQGAVRDGVVEGIDPSLDVAYATTFYPEAADASGASAIQVRGGDEAEADLRMTAQPAVTITVPRDANDKPQNINPPQLQRAEFGDLGMVQTQLQITPTEYVMSGVAPGHYILRQPGGQGEAARSVRIDATGRSLEVGTGQSEGSSDGPASVRVVLQEANGAKFPRDMLVDLARRDAPPAPNRGVNQKGEVEFAGLAPGDYYFSTSKNYFATAGSFAGAQFADGYLHVAAGAALAGTVTLAQSPVVVVKGFVKADGVADGGAMVVMLPANGARPYGYRWRDQSNLDGSFQLSNVPPGKYVLVAIEDGWELAWNREEVMAPYLARGVTVAIPEGGGGVMKLPDAIAVQRRE